MINKFLPDIDSLAPLVSEVKSALELQGLDPLQGVIDNMRQNAALMAKQGVDQWLSYGVYLPAVERVISSAEGESEDDFYIRTGYPANVVEAYSVPGNDLATLVAADQYSTHHKRLMLKNTAEWCLNDDEQYYINLNQYENRLKALI